MKRSVSLTDELFKVVLLLFTTCPTMLNTRSLPSLAAITQNVFLARSLTARNSNLHSLSMTGEYRCTLVPMGAIWWGTRGTCPPHFFKRGGAYYAMSPHCFLFRFCIWRGFKNKSDVCHVLCEELFMLGGGPCIAKLMLKRSLVWYH